MVNKFWPIFFMFWPIIAIVSFVIAPSMDWWFPGPAMSPLGVQIDNLFYLILVIVTVTFVGTHVALGLALWRGVDNKDTKAWFSHGSHNLEVIWSIAPAGVLMFISLYQLDVWMEFRVKTHFPEGTTPVAEVTARQFEWRIRYPAPGKKLQTTPQSDDLYTVNDLHVPFGRPVSIRLRSMDVQHSFFIPELRVKQDAVPGTVIPVWFEASALGEYDLLCAELCGWGHYKMRGRVFAENETGFEQYLKTLQAEQNFDGVTQPDHSGAQIAEYGIEDSQ
ncbi:MAG: cytochrome c oxidase subunit 2 [Porticoccaceae bacterium]